MPGPIQFARAERISHKLKIGIQGPSGAGKTLGALILARNMVGPTGKIALIDTENGSASLYADDHRVGGFDTINLEPPFESKRYIEIIAAAEEAGYDVLVIDSISHEWNGEGGILDRKEKLDAQGRGNSYTNWATFSNEHTRFLQRIVSARLHIIATLRAKSEYVIEQQGNKAVPKKMGMAAITREGSEYEFSIVFDVQMSHRATAMKDRTDLFADETPFDLADKKIAKRITDWLAAGKAPPPPDLRVKLPGNASHFEGWGGKAIADVPSPVLVRAIAKMQEADADKYASPIEEAGEVLAARVGLGEAVPTREEATGAAPQE